MSDRTEKIKNIKGKACEAGKTAKEFIQRHAPDVASTVVRGTVGFLLGYGATAFLLDVTGLTDATYKATAAQGYRKGFLDGETHAANLISHANNSGTNVQ